MEAQISVLERILARGGEWTEREERELELVGLGRAKLAGYGKLNGEEEERGRTGWREVFFGKKGKEFADDEASEGTDWEKRQSLSFFLPPLMMDVETDLALFSV